MVPVRELSRGKGSTLFHVVDFKMACSALLHAASTDAELARLPQLLKERCDVDRLLRNPYTGEPTRVGQRPGDFTVHRQGGRAWLCVYDMNMREREIALGSAPATQRK